MSFVEASREGVPKADGIDEGTILLSGQRFVDDASGLRAAMVADDRDAIVGFLADRRMTTDDFMTARKIETVDLFGMVSVFTKDEKEHLGETAFRNALDIKFAVMVNDRQRLISSLVRRMEIDRKIREERRISFSEVREREMVKTEEIARLAREQAVQTGEQLTH